MRRAHRHPSAAIGARDGGDARLLVGQKKAAYLAVRDWRRAPRHTALGGLLDGTLQVAWRSVTQTEESQGALSVVWEGSGGDPQ